MSRQLSFVIFCAISARLVRADHFDDHTAEVLANVADAKLVKRVEQITDTQLGSLPNVLKGSVGSGFLVIRTGDGNWCKLLARPARRTRKDKQIDNLILFERIVTYKPGNAGSQIVVDRKNVYLFTGYGIDLDIGQIVPLDTGDDLRFVKLDQRRQLETVNDADLHVVGKALTEPVVASKRKFGEASVQPADFAGTFKVEADGRWSGTVTLEVDETGSVSGSYLSSQTGRTYSVSGRVGNPANQITFTVELPMTKQEYSGYLWTRDRNRMTGTTTMQGRRFGFAAQRVE